MKTQVKRFLEFHGRNIYLSNQSGHYCIAVKPICEALGVDYVAQFKNLQEDPILGQLLSKQTMVAADGKLREMVCLPEKYVYGWLFSVRSESPDLLAYKRECYDVLYDFFHGSTTDRLTSLRAKTEAELEVERLERELKDSSVYGALQSAKERLKQSEQALKRLDRHLSDTQLDLFPSDDDFEQITTGPLKRQKLFVRK